MGLYHKSLKLSFTAFICLWSVLPAYSIAPRSQADGKFLYQFDVRRFVQDGYCLYTEPGRDQVLAFFLGEISSGNYHYYVIDVFDLSAKQRIGFIDFYTMTDKPTGKATTSFVTALEWWTPRTYKPQALDAAREYGFVLGNTDTGIREMHEFRKTAPVDPPPAIYIRKEFQRAGKFEWKHLADILMCFMLEASIRANASYISISPEDGLANRNFYERRYGALRQKGWYLTLYPSAYAKLGKVALNGMVFDFREAVFRPQETEEAVADATDIFIESISPFNEEEAALIDQKTQSDLFPDMHVWSLLKVLSEYMGNDPHSRLRQWVLEALKTRGKKPLSLPLHLEEIPEIWRPAVMTIQEKGLIRLKGLSSQWLPPAAEGNLAGTTTHFLFDRAA